MWLQSQRGRNVFNFVGALEKLVGNWFGAPYAVGVDCCTHAVELCLRYKNTQKIRVPRRTYLSIGFLPQKLGIDFEWSDEEWQDYYHLGDNIYDAAVLWQENSYIPGTMMCLSFQYQKHLSLGRGGMILLDNKEDRDNLIKMAYDGRDRDTPWRDQNISTVGYHYYMTPETAKLGLGKFEKAKRTEPKAWVYEDWPDISKMEVFK